MSTRIAVKVKRHNHPLDDEPRSRAIELLFGSVPMLLLFALIVFAQYKAALVVALTSSAVVFARERRELLAFPGQCWRRRGILAAVILPLVVVMLVAFSPFYLAMKGSVRARRALRDRQQNAPDVVCITD